MNGAYLHIATNHIPVIALPFAALLLLAGLARGSRDLIRASFAALVVIALITIFVYKTGGPAARVVHGWPGVQRSDIHAHAEAAEDAFVAAEVVGALALLGLWLTRGGRSAKGLTAFIFAAALITSGWLAWVAHLGGLIRHPEIRPGAEPPATAASQ